MSLSRPLSLAALLLLAACAGATPKPAESAVAPASSAPAASGDASAPVAGPRDPKIAALAKAALACKFEDNAFDTDCPEYKAWGDDEASFEDGKGDDTLFSMLGDPDLKVRLLGTSKDISSHYWEDKGHAKALASLAKSEKNEEISSTLGALAADVDWQTLGMTDTLKDLVQHAPKPFRRTIAARLNQQFVTPAVVDADSLLVEDPDQSVADTAVEYLHLGDSQEPLCKLMGKLMAGEDFRHSTAILAASHADRCAGMKGQVAAELAKRLTEPAKIDNNKGWDYVRAARHLCLDNAPEVKKKGLDLMKKLAAPAIPDAHTRYSAVDDYAECDPKGAAAFVATWVNDKAIGKNAKETLANLKKKK